jgi:7,8-dihydropterin-6-yl-methyl-4-(beta-D-ribofuranosyl)aminobenzene 5'-phosphate synthase
LTKISILTENTASEKFKAEFGLSYLAEHNRFSLLFDTGHSDLFLQNAKKLSIDISQIDIVVLSHGHWDHGNGLRFLKNKKLICHPEAFRKRYSLRSKELNGIYLTRELAEDGFDLIQSREPYYISDEIIFLGEIPRLNDFETVSAVSYDENGEIDQMPDDSALAIVEEGQIIVVSGCAHSGICNTIEYAKKVTKISKIKAVIGGFHLLRNDLQTAKTIEYLKNEDIEQLLPSHCTELPALCAISKEFDCKQVKAGFVFEF